jgi:hypothetical protein
MVFNYSDSLVALQPKVKTRRNRRSNRRSYRRSKRAFGGNRVANNVLYDLPTDQLLPIFQQFVEVNDLKRMETVHPTEFRRAISELNQIGYIFKAQKILGSDDVEWLARHHIRVQFIPEIREIYTEPGHVLTNRKSYLNGKLHSFDDKPALYSKETLSDDDYILSAWYKDGVLHRDNIYSQDAEHPRDKPAVYEKTFDPRTQTYRKSISWYIDGRKHRENGPAIIEEQTFLDEDSGETIHELNEDWFDNNSHTRNRFTVNGEVVSDNTY